MLISKDINCHKRPGMDSLPTEKTFRQELIYVSQMPQKKMADPCPLTLAKADWGAQASTPTKLKGGTPPTHHIIGNHMGT